MDFGYLNQDLNVTDTTKRLLGHTFINGQVNIITVTIKYLKAMVYWYKYHQKRGLDLELEKIT